jgi:hypothetical protein
MQRTATPLTPVRFRPQPPFKIVAQYSAGIAQLVEHDLAKVGVASSNLVFRSKRFKKATVHLSTVAFFVSTKAERG